MKWPVVKISKVRNAIGTRDPRRTPDAFFKYVDISGIDRESKTISTATAYIGSDAPGRARQEIVSNDILVSTVRPNLNAVAMVPPELDGEIASTGFCVLRANLKAILPKFLFYLTQTQSFIESLLAQMRGANYPAVTDRNVYECNIPLPPLSEQRKIVEILDEADALRRKGKEADEKASRILTALFYDMFGDPVTNKKGWKKTPLGDLIKVKSGDFLPAKEMDSKGKYPVFGGNGINGFHSKCMFDTPKIIIGRVGAYCGSINYAKDNCWITDNALFINEQNEALNDLYLVKALQIVDLNRLAGRAGQPLISGSRIYPAEILVPPINLQIEFAKCSEHLETIMKKAEKAILLCNSTFSTLLHRAFAGSLTAGWREKNCAKLETELSAQLKAIETANAIDESKLARGKAKVSAGKA
jgi:type I restriction enzyme S subunit